MNKEFVKAYNDEFQRNPDFFSVGGYDGMHLIYEALKKTGGKADGDSLIAAAKGMGWESPRGPIIDRSGNPRHRPDRLHPPRREKVGGNCVNVEFDKVANVKDPGQGADDQSDLTRSIKHRRLPAMPPVFGVLFDGLAYGMLLFLLSVGLSVTLGMMNFVNLAHCSFAMLGGYVTVTLMNSIRLAVLRHAAGCVHRRRRGERRARAHVLPALLSTPATSTSAC